MGLPYIHYTALLCWLPRYHCAVPTPTWGSFWGGGN